MENHIRILVFTRRYVHPKLSHEKHLIGIVRNCAVSGRPRLLDPVSQTPDEVKEEIRIRNRDDLVSNLDKDTESSAREKVQFLHDRPHQVLGFDGRVNKEGLAVRRVTEPSPLNSYLFCVVREINLVKYLRSFVLNCLNLNLVRW